MFLVKVIDYDPNSFESLGKGNWGEYLITIETNDGQTLTGTCQGDTHLWALETFVGI